MHARSNTHAHKHTGTLTHAHIKLCLRVEGEIIQFQMLISDIVSIHICYIFVSKITDSE